MKQRKWLIVLVGMALLLQSCTQQKGIITPTDTDWEWPKRNPTPTIDFPIDSLGNEVIFRTYGNLELFNPLTGYLVIHPNLPSTNGRYELSPDGKYLAFIDSTGVFISDYPFSTFKKIAESDADRLGYGLSFNIAGDQLAYTDKHGLGIWNLESSSGMLVLPYAGKMLEKDEGDEMGYTPQAWSPDGHWLIFTEGRNDYFISKILNTATFMVLDISNNRQKLIWLPDSLHLLAAVSYDCMAESGFEDGIYWYEITETTLLEHRIWSAESDPECGERSYDITGIDHAGGRIFFRQWLENSSGPPLRLAISYKGEMLQNISGDCYSLAGITELADGDWLCASSVRIYKFDPVSSLEETILEWPNTSMTHTSIPDYLSPDHRWLLVKKDNQYILLNALSIDHNSYFLTWAHEYMQILGWIKVDQLQ